MRISRALIDDLNTRFQSADPVEILRFAHATFGRRAAILTSMQRAGTALCYLAERAGLDFDVLFVDTGLMHQETLATRDALTRAYPLLRVRTLSPDRTFAEQTAAEGLLYLSREGQERCCELRKSAPLAQVRGDYDALIGALRKGEGGARSAVEPFGVDPEMGALRIHPFSYVASDELDTLIAQAPDIVLNPLHAMGFPTIGCFPCTTPVRPDEPERAGRWRHLSSVEYCGINPIDRARFAEIDLDDRYAGALAGASAIAAG